MSSILTLVKFYADFLIVSMAMLVVLASPVWLALLSTVIFAAIRAWLVYRNTKNVANVFKAQIQVSDCMRDILALKAVNRVLFFEAVEISTEPNLLRRWWQKISHKYDNIRHIVNCPNGFSETNPYERLTYSSIAVDRAYSDLLRKIKDKGNIELVVQKMPNCLLKNIYQKNAIKYSVVFKIYFDKRLNTLYYMSVASRSEILSEDVQSYSRILMNVNQIRQIYNTNF